VIGFLAAGFLGVPAARAALQDPPAKSAKAAPSKDFKVLFVYPFTGRACDPRNGRVDGSFLSLG
jgi:hypothetical protein